MSKSILKKNLSTKHLALIGMMGAGKSSIGRALSTLLERPFVDVDTAIEAHEGLSVAHIFSTQGEAAFRTMERATLERLLDTPPSVLSLGGGAFMDEKTRNNLKNKAISVWIKVDPDLLIARVSRQTTRPLLQNTDVREKILTLLDARSPTYAQADLTVQCNAQSIDENAQTILKALQDAQAPQNP